MSLDLKAVFGEKLVNVGKLICVFRKTFFITEIYISALFKEVKLYEDFVLLRLICILPHAVYFVGVIDKCVIPENVLMLIDGVYIKDEKTVGVCEL